MSLLNCWMIAFGLAFVVLSSLLLKNGGSFKVLPTIAACAIFGLPLGALIYGTWALFANAVDCLPR